MYGFYQQPYGGSEQLIRVTGLDGAKAYQMRPNSAVALFDGAEDIFYLKSTDDSGLPIRGGHSYTGSIAGVYHQGRI